MKTWQILKQNPELFKRYFVKEYMIKACRKFFEHRGYHELESPILAFALPQERYLDVLETKIELANSLSMNGEGGSDLSEPGEVENKGVTAYIIPTTETYNKKILAAGLGEHFVITKVCRGTEQISPNHSPEFTMLEWYHLDTDYKGLMQDTEELFIFIKKYLALALSVESKPHVKGENKIKNIYEMTYDEIVASPPSDKRGQGEVFYQDQQIDLASPWIRLSIPEVLEKYCGIRLEEIQDVEDFRKVLKTKGYNVDGTEDWQTLFEWVFAQEIETKLPKNKPVFLYDYPKQICVLTKPNEKNPLVCEKVELYIAGKELANGYTELLDWKLQEENFKKEQAARKVLGMKPIKFDTDLIEALKSGMPNVGGIGMGLDRVAMLFANAKTIDEINYFPASENI
jgi:elongation factor P--beta-lysine ligase